MYDQAYLHSYEKAIVYNNGDVTATCINMRYCLNAASSLPQEKRVVIYDSSYEVYSRMTSCCGTKAVKSFPLIRMSPSD